MADGVKTAGRRKSVKKSTTASLPFSVLVLADPNSEVEAALGQWAKVRFVSPEAHLAADFQEILKSMKEDGFDIVVNLSENPYLRGRLQAASPATMEGANALEILARLKTVGDHIERGDRLNRRLAYELDETARAKQELTKHMSELETHNRALDNRLAEMYFTHELFKALSSSIDLDEVGRLLVDGAMGILGAEVTCFYLVDDQRGELRLHANQGMEPGVVKKVIKVGEGILGRVAKTNRFVSKPNAGQLSLKEGFLYEEKRISSLVAVPLAIVDRVLGVLVISTTQPRTMEEDEVERLLTIAHIGALSLQNALLHSEIARLSVTDRLTELYNHGYFQQRLGEELDRAQRFGHKLSLIMMDIDHFKEFNDTFGHPKGDIVLKKVADILRSNIRDIDTPARYGGEEFIAILPETDKQGALIVAERIRQVISKTNYEVAPGKRVKKTASFGVATFPSDADTQPHLIERADQALYQAKRTGRNAVVDCASLENTEA